MTERRSCPGTTKAGKPCRNKVAAGELYCRVHNEEATATVELAKRDVIDALPTVYSWGAAAKIAGIGRSTLFYWLVEDPGFAAACHDARAAALDRVESALVTRAVGLDYTETTRERVDGELVVTKTVDKVLVSDKAAEIILSSARGEYRRGYEGDADPGPDRAAEAARAIVMNEDAAQLLDAAYDAVHGD